MHNTWQLYKTMHSASKHCPILKSTNTSYINKQNKQKIPHSQHTDKDWKTQHNDLKTNKCCKTYDNTNKTLLHYQDKKHWTIVTTPLQCTGQLLSLNMSFITPFPSVSHFHPCQVSFLSTLSSFALCLPFSSLPSLASFSSFALCLPCQVFLP